MSSPDPRNSGLSYANVAAGTLARAGRSQIPIAATYSYQPHRTVVPEILQMSRQERRHSVRAELDAGEVVVGGASWRRPSNGDPLQYDNASTYSYMQDDLPFFTPSYLARSKYVQRLKHYWEEHVQAQQDQPDPEHTSDPASSDVSSTTNLHRIRSSSPGSLVHRGVSQQVIERPPIHHSAADDKLRPLPSRWSERDKAPALEVLGDGSEVRFAGVQLKLQDDAASIRTDNAVPREVGLYYYEVTVLSKGKDAQIGVGFAPTKSMLSRLPGWEADSYAYHGDDGDTFSGSSTGRSYGPHFSSQDVIGCGINFRTNSIFFTKNGVFLGTAFSDLKSFSNLYPCIGLKKPSDHLRVNFGRQPFLFDIDAMFEHEHQLVMESISLQAVDRLHPPNDEATLLQNLIGQYLAHEGYVGTSTAFQQDLRERRRIAPSTSDSSVAPDDAEDDIHAINRQKIRRTILDGDIDRAWKYIITFFPLVLQDQRNREIKFRLRCRKFIEMMRQWSDLSSRAEAANGHKSANKDIQADTQMELDEQIQREATSELHGDDDVDMDSSTMQEDDLFKAAVDHGRGLQEEFGSDASPKVKKDLSDIFALMCYRDPRSSPLGHLLDKSGRASIAEELNGAILVSLGKPSSAALEKLCSQTEFFLDDVAHKNGGAAAFVNVREDFLHS